MRPFFIHKVLSRYSRAYFCYEFEKISSNINEKISSNINESKKQVLYWWDDLIAPNKFRANNGDRSVRTDSIIPNPYHLHGNIPTIITIV